MLIIDGQSEQAGRSLLGTCLGLSMATQTPFRMENISTGSRGVGLSRRELSLILAANQVCGGDLDGAVMGSQTLSFRPGQVQAGHYDISIGMAGSVTEVLLCLLPALMQADGGSSLLLQGGTHIPGSPSFDFLQRVFIPVLEQMGPRLRLSLERPGFYPAGGGKISAEIEPAETSASWEIYDAGRSLKNSATVLMAHGSKKIAQRQLEQVQKKLSWKESECHIELVRHSLGPGNVMILETVKENINALFCGYAGAHDSPQSATIKAIESFRRFVAQRVPVSPMLAETVLLPLALTKGGEFRTTPLSLHSQQQIPLIQRFLDVNISVEHSSRADATVRVQN